jgi:hypothetical protein
MMMLVLEFTMEFLSISFCESSLLFMAGGVIVDRRHPHSSPLAVTATNIHTKILYRDIDAATARPSELLLSG